MRTLITNETNQSDYIAAKWKKPLSLTSNTDALTDSHLIDGLRRFILAIIERELPT